jgi:DNA-binding NarL/FixJ family response regulator
MALVAKGFSNRRVAYEMVVPQRTANSMLTYAYNTLGVPISQDFNTRVKAVLAWQQRELPRAANPSELQRLDDESLQSTRYSGINH